MLIGSDPSYVMVLDRDYYPEGYLQSIDEDLRKAGINLVFTPGKEIENLFLHPKIVHVLIPKEYRSEWDTAWKDFLKSEYLDSYGSFITLYEKFMQPRIDTKTYSPEFNKRWTSPLSRHNAVAGKSALQFLRGFYRDKVKQNITHEMLIDAARDNGPSELPSFIGHVFGWKS